MSYIYLSEKEVILHELEEIRFCGDLLEIEPNEDNITGRIIMQPLAEYYELLRRLREIEKEEEQHQEIFII